MTISDWVDVGLNAIGGAFVLFCLFEGSRRLRASGMHRSAVIMVAFGGSFCILWGGLEDWRYHMVSDVVGTLRRTVVMREFLTDWSKSVSAEMRETISLAHAKSAFLESGSLKPYVDASGSQRLYAPTQEDINQRETALVAIAKLEFSVRDRHMGALVWWLWGFLAVLFGVSFSRDERSMPANNTVDPDARGSP